MDKEVEWKALDSKVIAVASITKLPNGGGEWAAYIGAIAGRNYSEEWREVLDNGTKLAYDLAAVLFPDFARKYRWRE